MDIPEELNRLMAELHRVTKATEGGSLYHQPSTRDVDRFLSKYALDEDVVIEQIEITERGVFQFYMFAVWDPKTGKLSLFQMTE